MKIVIISNTTLDPLGRLLPEHEVLASGTGDLFPWLVDPSSPAADEATDIVLVCIEASLVSPPIGPPGAADDLMSHVEQFVARNPHKLIIVTTLVGSTRTVASFSDPSSQSSHLALHARWVLALCDLASRYPNTAVLDISEMIASTGRDNWLTETYWYLGRIRFTSEGFMRIGREVQRIIDAWSGRTRKVLVVDLDNTLWGGVLGEDGLGGLQLSDDGAGKCYRDFQKHLLALGRTGVLLAVVSKNDPDIVDEVFARHPAMVLAPEHFVRIDASWSNKADRIRDLAASLNLGLDSFVFIDDNPAERRLVTKELPDVAVPDFPDRPEHLSRWLIETVVADHFPRLRVLDEDRNKTQQYKARDQRRQAETADIAGFLASLDIELTFRTDEAALVQRISQLTQKTNQFNLTTERMDPGQVQRLIESAEARVITCDYADRFGDEGTIGVAILDLESSELVNLLLSCRVLGRNVEQALLQEVERQAIDQGLSRLRARYIPSGRNAVAAGFLVSMGYVHQPEIVVWTGEKELS